MSASFLAARFNRGDPPTSAPHPAAVSQGDALGAPVALLRYPAEAGPVGCAGALLRAYRSRGGTARSEALASRFHEHRRHGGGSLAQLIADGEIFGFPGSRTLWIPLFQFNPGELSARPSLRPILLEWRGVFDSTDIAAWFVDDNLWLGGRKPVDRLGTDPADVLGAARADRFIATG